MSRARGFVLAFLLPCVAACAALGPARAASFLTAGADCSDSTAVVYRWTFHFDPAYPADRPDWVGWDVMRRSVGDCGAFERANATPFPRTPNATESFEFSEAPPDRRATLEYRVVAIDAARQPVPLDPLECLECHPRSYTSCPEASAPLVHGIVEEMGWAVMVMPCAGTCYTTFYVENPAADALRPHVGTAEAVRLYGIAACGTVEGCTLQLDRFDLAPCDPVLPGRPSTWGRVKTLYR